MTSCGNKTSGDLQNRTNEEAASRLSLSYSPQGLFLLGR
nr:MAG TPA: hypothetical protein [Caudoviricetes sp.]